MSMKSSLLAMAAFGAIAMAGPGHHFSGGRGYNEPKRPREHKPFPISNDIPKGHKQDILEFSFILRGYQYEALIPFTYGTSKSRLKRRNALYNELKNYITNTPHELLVKFGQFFTELKYSE